jgi:Zn-dependent protease
MFKNIKLFRVFGVDVYLNATWFLIFALFFTWTGTTLPLFLSELSTVMILFSTVLFHEIGHVLAARKYGVDTEKIVLHLLGGAAFIDEKGRDKLTHKQMLWVYFAGPLVNLALGVIFFLIFTAYVTITGNAEIDTFMILIGTVFLINGVMFIFNMLPIYPMDGGGILRNLMQHFKVKNAIKISAIISSLFCLALLVFSISFGSIGGMIISVIFFLYAIAEYKKELSEDGIIRFGSFLEIDTNKGDEDLDNS